MLRQCDHPRIVPLLGVALVERHGCSTMQARTIAAPSKSLSPSQLPACRLPRRNPACCKRLAKQLSLLHADFGWLPATLVSLQGWLLPPGMLPHAPAGLQGRLLAPDLLPPAPPACRALCSYWS